MNRSIQSTDSTAQARADGLREARRSVADGSAGKTQAYQEAYDAGFREGLARWGRLHGRSDAAKAAQDEHLRRDRAADRANRT